MNAQSEWEVCSEPEWTEKMYMDMLSLVPSIKNYSTPENEDLYYIPVVFYVYRNSEGNTPSWLTQANTDWMISKINTLFGESKLRFYRWGNAHFIDNDYLFYQFNPYAIRSDWRSWPEHNAGFRSDFAHVEHAIVVHVPPTGGNSGKQPIDPPPNQWINIQHNSVNSSVFPHEGGHIFGLRHTFGAPQKFDWIVLDSAYIDHPYTGTFPRELVIRDTAWGENFPYPNCETAGDFLCDTPPQCYCRLINNNCFSDFFYWPDSTCIMQPGADAQTCPSGYLLYSAIDYNQDIVHRTDQQEVRNLMGWFSYDTLTPGQIQRMHFFYDSIRVHQFDTSIHVNFRDYVEFEDTDKGLRNIMVRSRHATDSLRFTNILTNKDGFFFGALYDTLLHASVFTMGSGDSLHYNVQDWLAGLDMEDMFLIQKHILGTEPLNGYRQLAADVNGSGSVTTLDMKYIKGLLLGIYNDFPHPLAQPWVFVPEFIPHEQDSLFHVSPFNLTINGVGYSNEAPYIYPAWEYVIADGLGGSAGFDGVKLGDVNGSVLEPDTLDFTCGNELSAEYASHFFEEGEYYNISFSLESTSDLVALQLGVAIDTTYFLWEDWGDLESEQVLLTAEDVSYNSEDSGVRAVWFSETGSAVDFSSGRTLFSIVLKVTTTFSSSFSAALHLSAEHLKSMAYNEHGCRLPLDVEIDVEHLENRSSRDTQYQQASLVKVAFYPNPVRGDEGRLVLYQKQAGTLDIHLTDTYGRQQRMWQIGAFEGSHEQELRGFSELGPGLYFLLIRREGQVVATHKIVIP